MYITYFFYEVDPEKQEEYLKATRDIIKPFWLAHGTYSYDVYQEYDRETGKPGTRFIKTQIMDGMPRPLEEARVQYPEGAKEIVDTFYSFTKNVSFQTYIKKI